MSGAWRLLAGAANLGGRRLIVVAVAVALVNVGAWLRFETQHTDSYNATAMVAAGDGILVTSHDYGLLRIDRPGTVRRLGQLPGGTPLALVDTPSGLVLGTDGGLFVSVGRLAGFHTQWRRARGVPGGRFAALAASGPLVVAGAWSDQIWVSHDQGASWLQATAPGNGREVESFWLSDSALFAATETGILRSLDSGLSWSRVFDASRTTAICQVDDTTWASDWEGNVYTSPDRGQTWSSQGKVNAGIWGMLGSNPPLLATTQGIFQNSGSKPMGLAGREVTAIVQAGHLLYATVSRDTLYRSDDGGLNWRAIKLSY